MKFRDSWLHEFLTAPIILIVVPLLMVVKWCYGVWWLIHPPTLKKERLELMRLITAACVQQSSRRRAMSTNRGSYLLFAFWCAIAMMAPMLSLAQTTLTKAGEAQRPALQEGSKEATRAAVWPMPLVVWSPPQSPPLEVRIPWKPTVFPSAGRVYLTYELHLRNFGARPLILNRIEVLDGDAAVAKPIAALEGAQLDPLLGTPAAVEEPERRKLAAGSSAVVFLSIALNQAVTVPAEIRHRLVVTSDGAVTSNGIVDVAKISTRGTKELRILGAPLKGYNWLALAGPSNDSHHRRGLFVFDGQAVISGRYAIDWIKLEDGSKFFGNGRSNKDHYAYGQEVLAVADGMVSAAVDGIADSTPGAAGSVSSLSIDTLAGNVICIDLGDGQFATYAHLQPGSLRVKVGDRVKRGQVLGLLGNSGNSTAPHLHFEVTTAPAVLNAEGLPYLIDHYETYPVEGGKRERRTAELPLKDMLVDFGPFN